MSELEVAWIKAIAGRHITSTDDGRCSLLTSDGRCAAHLQRPLICRIWGIHPDLRCPFGCQPERWITDLEAAHVLTELEALDIRAQRYRRIGAEPDPSITAHLVGRALDRINNPGFQ